MSITEFDFHQLVKPRAGHMHAGDMVFFEEDEASLKIAIIDGVGHGSPAHEVAVRTHKQLEKGFGPDLLDTMNTLNDSLAGSIGAAVGLCLVDKQASELSYLGVGNTVLRKLGSENRQLVSLDGTVGLYMRSPKEFTASLEKDDVVILHTDGISTQYNREDFPKLRIDRAKTIAETLVQRFGKAHDDAGCAVLKIKS